MDLMHTETIAKCLEILRMLYEYYDTESLV